MMPMVMEKKMAKLTRRDKVTVSIKTVVRTMRMKKTATIYVMRFTTKTTT